MRPSLVKRAKEREVNEGKSPGIYVVSGKEKLGDKYPSYIVRERNGEWTCDCLSPSRTGGQYRSTCSHITGVLLHIEEHGEWTGPNGEVELPDEIEEPARKASVSSPTFEDTHHPVKTSPPTNIEWKVESFIAPEPVSGFPDSSSEGLDGKNPGENLPTFTYLEPEHFWDLIDQDPDWIPHPGQIKLHQSEPELPQKFQEFRESQWMAIREIDAALDEGYKVVFVSAPTGSGKTLLAETVRRIRGIRGIYTCTTKTLQDQILREFEYAKVIKGRANYPTLNNPDVTAADCNKRKTSLPACNNCPGWSGGNSWGTDNPDMTDPTLGNFSWHCTNCHPWDECPYERAKMEAGSARLAVLNTAYFLAETNYVDNSLFRGRGLALIDEADMLESELMRFIEVTITARDRKMLGVGLPEKKTVDESWVEWLVEEVLPACREKIKEVNPSPDLFGDFNVDDLRLKKKLIQLLKKVKSLTKEVVDEETGEIQYVLNDNWIYCADEQTEILTEDGWKRYDEVSEGEFILSLDPETQLISWLPIQKVNVFPYDGELVHWQSNRMDALVTDDHRWVSHGGFRKTKEIADNGTYVQLAGGDPTLAFASEPTHPDELVKLVGWLVTEGWLRPDGAMEINQSLIHNPTHCLEIGLLADWLRDKGFHVRDQSQKNGTMHRWYIGVEGGRYLVNFIPNKQITPKFLRSLTVEQGQLLFDTLMHGDGHVDKGGSRYWAQKDQGRIAGYQMLLAMLGIRSRSRKSKSFDASEVVGYRTKGAFTRTEQFSRETYKGNVWCPTVATGTWMARRNGVTYWTGNTGYEKNMKGEYPPDDKVSVTFKPVHVEDWAHPILWSKAGQFVLLSATFVAPAMEAEFLGLEDDEWTVVEVPSSFPVIQRPIIPRLVANVINKEMQTATPILIDEIETILTEHPNDRVLIHSVSYKLTKDLYYELRRTTHGNRLETYFDARDREGALDRYLSKSNGVLIAPSFDRGVDLPADDCRVIIVAKIPYLSVGDKQVSARLFGTGKTGKMWYAIQAIRTLCQMTGRGMRSAEDSCRTYILDRQFSRLYNENRRLFPKWWAEAIVWDVNDPKWKGMA